MYYIMNLKKYPDKIQAIQFQQCMSYNIHNTVFKSYSSYS